MFPEALKVVKAPEDAEVLPTEVPSIAPPFMSTVAAVRVPVTLRLLAVPDPVNAGLLASALVAMAVDMLSNSVSNSEPLMILLESPEGNESLAAKSVVFT